MQAVTELATELAEGGSAPTQQQTSRGSGLLTSLHHPLTPPLARLYLRQHRRWLLCRSGAQGLELDSGGTELG
jgi:hypothetical protein